MAVTQQMNFISKRVGNAIADYDMMQDGDKIMVAVSGGKDSLSLLQVMQYRQSFIPVGLEIVAVHVDAGMPDFPMEQMIGYFKEWGVAYHIEKADLLKGKTWETIDCYQCSRERRKVLFELADKMGCNKIALGHHMDDIVETILLNMFYRGEIGSMCPKQELFDGKLAIIRPLAYIKEEDVEALAHEGDFLDISPFKCPNDETSKRRAMKDLLAQLEKENSAVKKNIIHSLENIKYDYLLEKKGVSL